MFQKVILRLVFSLSFAMCTYTSAQVKTKRTLTEDDYHKWHTLLPENISGDGSWLSYRMSYDNREDTLFVKGTVNHKLYAFPKAYNGIFLDNDHFACLSDNKHYLTDLRTGKIDVTESVNSFTCSAGTRRLIMLNQKGAEQDLLIKDIKGRIVLTIKNVISWMISPTEDSVGYISRKEDMYEVGVLKLSTEIVNVKISEHTQQYMNIVWQKNGKGFCFLQRPYQASDNETLHYYCLKDSHLYTMVPTAISGFPEKYNLADPNQMQLVVSDDGQKIFFGIKSKEELVMAKETVQVWNTEDNIIYPANKRSVSLCEVAVWWPFENRISGIGTTTFAEIGISTDFNFALCSDPYKYEPQNDIVALRDYEILDLKHNTMERLLTSYRGSEGSVSFSPGGKFILYSKAKDWYVYNLESKKHINITKDIDIRFFKEDYDNYVFPHASSPYGCPGWTIGDDYLLLNDEFDIWKVSTVDGLATRLTKGREQGIVFRISPSSAKVKGYRHYDFTIKAVYDLSDIILLESKGKEFSSGYSILTGNSLKNVIHEDERIIYGKLSQDKSTLMFTRESYDTPPSLWTAELSYPKKKVSKVVQSNNQHYDYYWGKSELITYTALNGKKLSGVLFYPSEYKWGQRYPMIVHIYEKQSNTLHLYRNAGFMSEEGFNIANLTSLGYLVLLPDIDYVVGKPGESARECVTAAVQKVVGMKIVDESNIGLIGHSFGGFQTNYIVTHSHIFKAAVAGGAINDLTSWYLSLSIAKNQLQFWRFESAGNMRVGQSLFADKGIYHENSPVLSADQLDTNLLSWSGSDDITVPVAQSIEMFLALRRLNKKHVFLLYPNEDHSIIKPENKADLTKKVESWFGHYLKGEALPVWLNKNH